jgi:hypothetical protein
MVQALGLDQTAADMTRGTEIIEHVGEVTTYVADLEARWQAEAAQPRLVVEDDRLLLDAVITVPADAATCWSNLTSPALRARWEGAVVIDLNPAGGHPGVGTTLQCVTGRLATIEEIVDWQPFEHVGYRVVVPDVGVLDATYDLEATDGSTVIRQRWGGDSAIDVARAREVLDERRAALGRLATLIGAGREAVARSGR